MSETDYVIRFSPKAVPIHWDRIVAGLGIVAVLPLMMVISITLCALGQSPIFTQKRVGYREGLFTIYKFRTLPRQGWDAYRARTGNMRPALYSRLARVLRVTGLDELPQLWNVFLGDMRIMGPRPLTMDDYQCLPDFRLLRCRVPPGIVGLAQVNGGQALDPASKLALDLYQIENMSIGLWFTIVIRSACRLLGHTRLVASPCRVTLRAAWLEVDRLMHGSDTINAAKFVRQHADREPKLDGSVT